MDAKVRWGVIGCGGIAFRRTIPEGILPARNASLISVYDVDAERTVAAAELFGARTATSIEDLLASEIDCVYIATPTYLHRAQALASAAAGKNVLCEKPLGLTVSEAEEMVTTFQDAGLKLGTGFMMRFQAQHLEARSLIDSGQLGQPVYARAQLSCWYPEIPGAWRQDLDLGGGGALMDMGGHCLDLLEMFFGPVAAVTAKTRRLVHGYKAEDGAVVTLEFENGALGTVDTFFSVPDTACENVLELYGSKGSILARGTIGQGSSGTMCAKLGSAERTYDPHQDRSAVSQPISPAPVNTYCQEIEEFGCALLGHREPEISGRLGLRNQRLLSACYLSARTGGTIRIDGGA
jgi:predicted dehydrogenase